VLDFFVVFIALLVYAIINYFFESSLQTSVPIIALLMFAVAFPTGVIGLLYERANLLVIYNTRLCIIMLWSIAWTL
ncbi:hypothetical protein GCK32_013311, partial [Trichostrongylus colubriformis]